MSYHAQFYSVDIGIISGFFGSKKYDTLKEIVALHSTEINQNAEWFSAEIEDGAQRLDKVLEDFFTGTPDTKNAFQNWYATELLCRHFGEQLNTDDDVGFISKFKFKSFLAKPRYFLPLGAPDDFPEVSYLLRTELPETVSLASEYERNLPTNIDADSWNAFISYLKKTEQLGVDLVVFTY